MVPMLGRTLTLSLLVPLGAQAVFAQAPAPAPAAKPLAPLGATAPLAKTAPLAVEEPRDVIAALYRLETAELGKENGDSPFFSKAARRTFFTKSFDLLITTSEAEAAKDGGAFIDFDPIASSNDPEVKTVTLKTDLVEMDKAVVSASFSNHGQPIVVAYDFMKEGAVWKIDDIKGTTEKEAWSVRKILDETGAAPTKLPK